MLALYSGALYVLAAHSENTPLHTQGLAGLSLSFVKLWLAESLTQCRSQLLHLHQVGLQAASFIEVWQSASCSVPQLRVSTVILGLVQGYYFLLSIWSSREGQMPGSPANCSLSLVDKHVISTSWTSDFSCSVLIPLAVIIMSIYIYGIQLTLLSRATCISAQVVHICLLNL